MIPSGGRQPKQAPAPEPAPLIDGLGRQHTYLRISVTDRCNLRCVYCMPAEGINQKPRDEILRFDEILRLVHLFARMGVTKVRLTGGEPLVRRDIEQLVVRIAGVPGVDTIGLTTNGILLPEMAVPLRAAGVTRLNVSLDTLRPERFERITLRDEHDAVLAGVQAALTAGFVPLRLNVVVMGGVNDDEVLDFVRLTADRPIAVRFIEYMPFRANKWRQAAFVPYAVMWERIGRYCSLVPIEVDPQATAAGKEFRVPGFAGTVGFITAMSAHFCGRCNRIRLMADGSLKSCLFDGAPLCLRPALRAGASDAELELLIRQALLSKPEMHPPAAELATSKNQSMIQIGG